ncbi:MAG: hypothetical protein GWN00_04005 [Aliifodinibius sp.]|nr:hypothetical protein [Fodinibius sp.]NIW98553.1 hypothetical protein [Phycisphaerae bacterium]NIY23998.1 hypothetical protein [Fodinibius sp.]
MDDVYNNQTIVLFDDSDDDAPSVRTVSDYDGDTQTVTLSAAPDFTVASDDSVKIFVTPAAVSLTGPTAADVADAVWDETSTGHTDAGKAGAQLWTDIDAILADSNELQGDWTDGGRLDLLIDAILADTNELQGDITDGGRIDLILDAILADTAALPGNILDETIEGTLTYRQIIKIFLAVLAGKSSGGGSQSLAFRDNADAKNRVAATVDANGNRTAVTLDGS